MFTFLNMNSPNLEFHPNIVKYVFSWMNRVNKAPEGVMRLDIEVTQLYIVETRRKARSVNTGVRLRGGRERV